MKPTYGMDPEELLARKGIEIGFRRISFDGKPQWTDGGRGSVPGQCDSRIRRCALQRTAVPIVVALSRYVGYATSKERESGPKNASAGSRGSRFSGRYDIRCAKFIEFLPAPVPHYNLIRMRKAAEVSAAE